MRPVDPACPPIGARVVRCVDGRHGTVTGHRGGRELAVEWDEAPPWRPDDWREWATPAALAEPTAEQLALG